MSRALCVAALGLFLAASAALAIDTRLPDPSSLSPLKARLVVHQDTYVLAPNQRGEAFRAKLKEEPGPAAAGNGQAITIMVGPGQIQVQGAPNIQVQVNPAKAQPAKPEKKDEKKPEPGTDQAKPPAPDQPAAQPPQNAPKPEEPKAEDRPKDQDKQPAGPAQAQGNVQVFQAQGGNGQVQVQAQIVVQGGVVQGQPNVQVMVLGGGRPFPPLVNLALEIENITSQELTLLVGPDAQLELKLKGPGAVTVRGKPNAPAPVAMGNPAEVKLAPGGKYTIPIRRLMHGRRNADASYWTEPGEYRLSATYTAALKSDAPGGSTPISMTAPAVTLKVTEPK